MARMDAQGSSKGPFYHGTKAVLRAGDELVPGFGSNFQEGRVSNHVYFTALLDTAAWGAELATALAGAPERGRIYVVEPLGSVSEVVDWEGHAPDVVKAMLDGLAVLRQQGRDVIED
jgi:hypothetical protein